MKSARTPRRAGAPTDAGHRARDPHLAALTRTNHDLRSPLSVILGVFELLEDTASLRDSERRYVKLGSDAAAELLNQADAVRLYCAMARNLVTLETAAVDVAALARERLQAALARRHVALQHPSSKTHPVRGDAGYLNVALSALARHLAAHLPEPDGGAPLNLRLEITATDRNTVLLSLQLADTVQQAAPETPEPGEADLAVVNAVRLIELMHGRVTMNAEQPYLHLELPSASAA